MAFLDVVLRQVTIFALFAATLIVPLLLIPEFLLRRGVAEWKTRIVGWWVFAALLLVFVVLFGRWRPSIEDLTRWDVYLGSGAILFAAWWDVRRARRKEAAQGKASGKALRDSRMF